MIKKHFHKKLFEICILCCFVWGLISHGMAIFNKYSFHDDVGEFNRIGATYTSGRWFLGEIEKFAVAVFGSTHYSTPAFNGFITILCLALMIYFICERLEIRKKTLIALLCGILISFPAITGIFGYIFTAPYYYFGALLGVIGAYLYYYYRNIPAMLVCVTLMACSAGTYQSNIPINLCVLLLFMIHEVYNNINDLRSFIVLGLQNIGISLGFVIEYFLLNRFFLHKYGLALSAYKGIDNFGKTSKRGYVFRIAEAYRAFLDPDKTVSANMYPFHLRYFHLILIIISLILFLILLIKTKNIMKKIGMTVIFILYPLAAYFIYVMVGSYEVHGLMTYAESLTFILLAWILERLKEDKLYIQVLNRSCLILMGVMCFLFARFSNICYLKAEILQSEAISYFTTLITQIKSTEGYTDETPIIYLNEYNKKDNSLPGVPKFEPIYLIPYGDGGQENVNIYGGESLINDYLWEAFMRMWCGFSRIPGDWSLYKDDGRIKEMPHYPDYGSIQKLDDVIVVKF